MHVKVVLTHWVHHEVTDFLASHFEVIPNETRDTLPQKEIIKRASDADAIMVFMPDSIDDDFLAACPNLKMVSAALKGFDNIDVESCTRRGVLLTIIPDLLTVPTADLTLGLLLGLTRRILEGDRFVRSGEFRGWRPRLYGAGLAGSCVGIVGMGAVGQAVAKRLRGFEAKVVYFDQAQLSFPTEADLNAHRLSLYKLCSVSDFVILCLPLNPETKHLINSETIDTMKLGTYLVNTGRGSVVDEQAVAKALETGHLAGYAADVFEMEDWARSDHPTSISKRLLNMSDKTLFTPHLGSAVDEVRKEIAMEAARNMIQAFNGEILYGAVNQPIGWNMSQDGLILNI